MSRLELHLDLAPGSEGRNVWCGRAPNLSPTPQPMASTAVTQAIIEKATARVKAAAKKKPNTVCFLCAQPVS